MNKTDNTNIEIVIPKGYDIDDIIDTDDSIFDGEEPIYIEEVKIRFE